MRHGQHHIPLPGMRGRGGRSVSHSTPATTATESQVRAGGGEELEILGRERERCSMDRRVVMLARAPFGWRRCFADRSAARSHRSADKLTVMLLTPVVPKAVRAACVLMMGGCGDDANEATAGDARSRLKMADAQAGMTPRENANWRGSDGNSST